MTDIYHCQCSFSMTTRNRKHMHHVKTASRWWTLPWRMDQKDLDKGWLTSGSWMPSWKKYIIWYSSRTVCVIYKYVCMNTTKYVDIELSYIDISQKGTIYLGLHISCKGIQKHNFGIYCLNMSTYMCKWSTHYIMYIQCVYIYTYMV